MNKLKIHREQFMEIDISLKLRCRTTATHRQGYRKENIINKQKTKRRRRKKLFCRKLFFNFAAQFLFS